MFSWDQPTKTIGLGRYRRKLCVWGESKRITALETGAYRNAPEIETRLYLNFFYKDNIICINIIFINSDLIWQYGCSVVKADLR